MTNTEALMAARDLITDPAKWTRGALARDASGNGCVGESPNAVCWCAYGALERVAGPDNTWESDLLLNAASRALFGTHNAAAINDANSHEDVIAMFDKAIELAEKEVA